MCLSVSAAALIAPASSVEASKTHGSFLAAQMVWYMIDAGSESGGTWCVPGAHRDTRNPRGPRDGITVSAPIPGELQVEAPAGSVFIQDSRMCGPTNKHPTVHTLAGSRG